MRGQTILIAIQMDLQAEVSASVDIELVMWIDKEVETRRFASRTHAREFAISRLKNEIGKGPA